MNWRIEVDPDRCIGSGVCVGCAPRLFVLRDGVSVPLLDEVGDGASATDAAETCPVEAITVTPS